MTGGLQLVRRKRIRAPKLSAMRDLREENGPGQMHMLNLAMQVDMPRISSYLLTFLASLPICKPRLLRCLHEVFDTAKWIALLSQFGMWGRLLLRS